MTARVRFRDAFRSYVTTWLSDRPGKTVAFRLLWTMISVLDAASEVAVQGLQAAWPGAGTVTALPYIGRTRGILRGQADTDAEYVAKLLAWFETWRSAGSQELLARALHEYLGNHPRVRVVNRAEQWVTVNEDGTVEKTVAPWDWDQTTHPERAGFWSELWIIIYPTQWAHRTGGLGDLTGDDGHGLGHMVSHQEVDAVKGLLAQWKSAHTRVRCVIWTSDPALFDPANPATCPDGTWGAWGSVGNGSRVASSRNLTSCRYWEPG